MTSLGRIAALCESLEQDRSWLLRFSSSTSMHPPGATPCPPLTERGLVPDLLRQLGVLSTNASGLGPGQQGYGLSGNAIPLIFIALATPVALDCFAGQGNLMSLRQGSHASSDAVSTPSSIG